MITHKEDRISRIFSFTSRINEETQISHQLPKRFKGDCIDNAEITYVNDQSGSLVHQQITDKYWTIGMMNVATNETIKLNSVLDSPLMLICCVMNGQVNFQLPGHSTITLARNKYNICYIPAELQGEISFDMGEAQLFYIQFTSKVINSLSHPHIDLAKMLESHKNKSRTGIALPAVKIGIEERKIIDALKKYHSKESIAPLFIHARILDLFFAYFSSLEVSEAGSDRTNDLKFRLLESQKYIQQNYFLPLKINTLSRKAGMNIRTYEKLFKEMFQVPPREFIKSLRVEKAADLLKDTIMPVASIAHQVGFTAGNYFATVFREVYGHTPTEYRALFMICNGNDNSKSDKK
jgi:AraC-like DNA-binding protein